MNRLRDCNSLRFRLASSSTRLIICLVIALGLSAATTLSTSEKACAEYGCETFQTSVPGEGVKVCVRCCNEYGACQMTCH
jgi:hypothetical protein